MEFIVVGREEIERFKGINGSIKLEYFNVVAIGFDAINVPKESGQNPENEKPKAKIEKIRHLEVP